MDSIATHQLIEALISKRPSLKEILESSNSSRSYLHSLFSPPKAEALDPILENALKKAVSNRVARLFSDSLASNSLEYLSNCMSLVTSDHAGILSFPLLINSNLIHEYGCQLNKLPVHLSFHCGGVPLGNVSFPRGFFYRGNRIPVLRNSLTKQIFLAQPSYEIGKSLDTLVKAGTSEQDSLEIKQILSPIFSEVDRQIMDSLSDQITKVNYLLWPKYFNKGEPLPFISLQLEDLVGEIICEAIDRKHPLVHDLLFNPNSREFIRDVFSDIPGAWSRDTTTGTYLFWNIRNDKRAERLVIQEGKLVGAEGQFMLTPDAIATALRTHKIYPSVFLVYSVLSFIGGRSLLGGFNQIETLSQMALAFEKYFKFLGYTDRLSHLRSLKTNGLICGPKIVDCSGLDIIAKGGIDFASLKNDFDQPFSSLLKSNVEEILSIIQK